MDPIIVLQIRPVDSSSDLPRVLKMGWRLYPTPPKFANSSFSADLPLSSAASPPFSSEIFAKKSGNWPEASSDSPSRVRKRL